MIERISDEIDPWAELEEWNRDNFVWLYFGLVLLLIPGLFSICFLGRGLNVPKKDISDKGKVEKEYWMSSDTEGELESYSSSGADQDLHVD
mmetsp:Transcript_32636/g.55827  ORF Transcript_32636/g.55827 Transcript_32636/m.55827 type:complete len:91 (-) Transcript_32636:3-275(-)